VPKLKTHSGAKKRFKFTSKGKIKRKKAYASHILAKKSQERIRRFRKQGLVLGKEESLIKKLLPYGR